VRNRPEFAIDSEKTCETDIADEKAPITSGGGLVNQFLLDKGGCCYAEFNWIRAGVAMPLFESVGRIACVGTRASWCSCVGLGGWLYFVLP
jgi:hypothetical protein